MDMESTLLWGIPGREMAADPPMGLLRLICVAGSVSIGATVWIKGATAGPKHAVLAPSARRSTIWLLLIADMAVAVHGGLRSTL